MHKARYLIPGIMFSEEVTRELPERSPEAAVAAAPDEAFGFTLFDVADETPDLGPEYRVVALPQNESDRYYIDGVLLDRGEVEAMGDDFLILASNMRINRWDTVVRCRTGNYQPFTPGEDHLVFTGTTVVA